MTRNDFKKLANRMQLKPLFMKQTVFGTVLIAEGKFRSHPRARPEITGPVWQTMWAVERRGMDGGRPLYFKPTVSPDDRLAATIDDAMKFMFNRNWAESHEGQADAARG